MFRRRDFFAGPARCTAREPKDIVWLKPDGAEMTEQEWSTDFARCLGVYLSGEALGETDARGRPIRDDDFLLLFNAHHETMPFTLPQSAARRVARALLDTAATTGVAAGPARSTPATPIRCRPARSCC